MLLTYIAEVADEPPVLDPGDRRREMSANTRWLGATVEDRGAVSVPEVVAAFDHVVAAVRHRVKEVGFPGVATFYVWHDTQAGQLRCSTASVSAAELPFGSRYTPTADLAGIVADFLHDEQPGLIPWGDLDDVGGAESAWTEPEAAPFPVWVRNVGPD
ncbi:hypothetical protein LX16_4617 [Stackebrandtia albiflava]|uniref:Uncharacterized protein n=1 Tax=Stackebrandtia albiflava TaxID=406432 RepID=A0A562UQF9_9ACTN|nr:hypothetical protein [Stackebrandtia albiflava]TWJ07837.1 hypothetical protein LX16_4617 [Stackebrandtia albiflava]